MKFVTNLNGQEVSEKDIIRFMQNYTGQGMPPTATELAEQAADHFNLYEDDVDYPIPERLFEIAGLLCDDSGLKT